MKKIVLFIIIASLIAGGFKLIKDKKNDISNEKKAFVHVYKPLEQKLEKDSDNFEVFSAKLEAKQNPKISSKVSGYITEIFIDENQEIKKGDILANIDDSEYKQNILQLSHSLKALNSSINSSKASLLSLKLDMQLSLKEYKTNQKLYKIGGVSKDKLDFSQIVYEQKKAKYISTLKIVESKKSELDSQKAFLKSKEKLKKYYTLYSPIDGFIDEIFLDIGDLISVNKPILSIVSRKQNLSFLFITDTIKKDQKVFINKEKIGVIESIDVSSKNYMKKANIRLDKRLPFPINSLISIEVKTKWLIS